MSSRAGEEKRIAAIRRAYENPELLQRVSERGRRVWAGLDPATKAERQAQAGNMVNARWKKRRPLVLSAEELKDAIAKGEEYDAARNDGRFVYCRLCGRALVAVHFHLPKHGMSTADYMKLFPAAPRVSRHGKLKADDYGKKYWLRISNDPERRGKVIERLRVNKLGNRSRENAESILVFRGDPAREYRENLNYVVCREDNPRTGEPCGEHLEHLGAHLVRVHGLPKRGAAQIYQYKWARNGINPPIATQERLNLDVQTLGRAQLAAARARVRLATTPKKRGRKTGHSADTKIRIKLAAAFKKLNWTQKAMSTFVYRDTPQGAYLNTRGLFSEHRETIEGLAATMSVAEAESLVQVAMRAGR